MRSFLPPLLPHPLPPPPQQPRPLERRAACASRARRGHAIESAPTGPNDDCRPSDTAHTDAHTGRKQAQRVSAASINKDARVCVAVVHLVWLLACIHTHTPQRITHEVSVSQRSEAKLSNSASGVETSVASLMTREIALRIDKSKSQSQSQTNEQRSRPTAACDDCCFCSLTFCAKALSHPSHSHLNGRSPL